jgi:hypothetical protein
MSESSWHPAEVLKAAEDEVRDFVSDFIEEGFKAVCEPFTSSSPRDSRPASDEHRDSGSGGSGSGCTCCSWFCRCR